jgi:hypothetical protein
MEKKEETVEDREEEEAAEIDNTLASMNISQLDELADDCEEDEDKLLDFYRQRRLAEIKIAQMRNKFGDVNEIIKADWVREVTEASETAWVVCHLYQDSIVECRLMENALQVLAPRFPDIKFVKIKSTQAVENWPDRNLPSLFCYANGEMKVQSFTLRHLQGKNMKPSGMKQFFVCDVHCAA